MTKTTKMVVVAGLVVGGYFLYRRSHAAAPGGAVASGTMAPLATGGHGAGTGRNTGFVPAGTVTLPLHPGMGAGPSIYERPTL